MGQGRQGSGCKSKRVKMKSIEEKLAANQLDRLAKHWSGMKGKRIQPTDAIKLSAMVAKFGKDELEQLAAKDIPFLSMAAINNLMIKHNYNAAKIKSLMKEDTELLYDLYMFEDVDAGEYDYEGDMAKTQLVTISDAAEELHDMLEDNENMPEWCQNKITKAMDYLDSVRDYMLAKDTGEEPGDENPNESVELDKVKEAQIDKMKFVSKGFSNRKQADRQNDQLVGSGKASQKSYVYKHKDNKFYVVDMKEDLDEAATPAMKKAGNELSAYAKKNGGIDKADFMKAADMLTSGKAGMPFIKFVNDQDTEVFEKIITVMSKHMGRQTVEKMFKVRVREAKLDESKSLIKDYEKYMSQGNKKTSNAIDYLMSMPKYKRMSRDRMAKAIGDHKRKGIFREEVELDEKFEPKTAGMKITHKKPHPAGGHYVVLSKPGAGQHVIRHLNKGKVKTLGTVASLGLAKSYIDAKVKGKDPKDLIKKEAYNEPQGQAKRMMSPLQKIRMDKEKADRDRDGKLKRTISPLQKRANANKKAIDTGFMKLSKSDYEKEKKRLSGEGAMKRIATTQSNKAERIGSGGSKGLNTFKKKPQNEKLEVSDGMGAWIDDFKQSDAPQFKGKNAKERRDMAIAAYLDAKKDSE